MVTSAIYRLLDYEVRDGETLGPEFKTGGREKWDVILDVVDVAGGVSLAIVIETSVDGVIWGIETNFGGAKTGATLGNVIESINIKKGLRLIRARVTPSAPGDYTVQVLGRSAFLDPKDKDDRTELQPQLRNYSEVDRIVQIAEDDILELANRDDDGTLPLKLDRADFLDTMRRAIARQADHVYKRERLEQQKRSDSAIVTLRDMPRYGPGVERLLDDLRTTSAEENLAWFGR